MSVRVFNASTSSIAVLRILYAFTFLPTDCPQGTGAGGRTHTVVAVVEIGLFFALTTGFLAVQLLVL